MGDGNRQWNLLIKDVQRKDRGVYMCRVTTRTMLLAREIQLNIKGRGDATIVDMLKELSPFCTSKSVHWCQ